MLGAIDLRNGLGRLDLQAGSTPRCVSPQPTLAAATGTDRHPQAEGAIVRLGALPRTFLDLLGCCTAGATAFSCEPRTELVREPTPAAEGGATPEWCRAAEPKQQGTLPKGNARAKRPS